MELVYLWVEEYKNIHKQGFNFSPIFECNYDGKELTIKENDDYIENFFGENINVTAIVGKNGSGKSSLLKSILEEFYFKTHNKRKNPKKKSKNIIILKYENKLYVLSELEIVIKNNSSLKNITERIEELEDILLVYYDYTLSASHIVAENPYIVIPSKEDLENPIKNFIEKEKRILFQYIIDSKHNKTYSNYFTPNYLEIQSNINSFRFLEEIKSDIYDKVRQNIIENLKKILKEVAEQPLLLLKFVIYVYLCEQINNGYLKSHDLIKVHTFKELEEFFTDEHKEKYKKIFSFLKLVENYKNDIPEIFNKSEFSKPEIEFSKSETKWLQFEINLSYFKNNYENEIDLLVKLPNCFDVEIQEKESKKRYEDLSSGEKSAIRIRFYIEDIISKKEKDYYLILLDEPSNDMHPDWQKTLLHYLITVFKNRKEKFHFIFTTHSPFMISDLPKENIIFLKDGKNDKGINHNQTFGANIHTLLSDSFFMEDGLMGEFAKSKINEIIDFHKLVKKNRHTDCLTKIYLNSKQKKFWQTQKIIGEEYLKQVIKNHLVEIEKKLLGKDRAKQEEIKRVEAYLESLKK